MTTQAVALSNGKKSLIVAMANRYGLEPEKFVTILEKTILPSGKQASQEQVAAFLVVANEYELNPFIKEIYAFPSQGGGITPIVSVDGWLTLINRQPNLDGIQYQDHLNNEGKLTAITCRIFRKDRQFPNEITEYMSECKRNTSTWTTWPARMLRHKALIQCARQAFGFAGIYDPEEAERIVEAETAQVSETKAGLAGMKERMKVLPPANQTEPELEPITYEPEFISEPNERPDDSDEAAEQAAIEAETELIDPLESLRANVKAALEELPKSRQKDLIAGKPSTKDMNSDELNQLAIEIRKAA